MQTAPPRRLNSLEKTVCAVALFALLALTIGFAQAAGPAKRKAIRDDLARMERQHPDSVALRSAVALVQDAESGETILGKNLAVVMPIASITKLMTAIVTLDRGADLSQRIVVSDEDVDLVKGTRSRLATGSVLTRDELLLIALMASENRAAAALARTYPGGTESFVAAMNARARALGMSDTRFTDATGLSAGNVSSARDLARLVAAAHQYPLIRDYSTRESAVVNAYGRELAYRNTNGLVRSHNWEIGLSKTGFISEAGRCLVMRVRFASRNLIVVLLDSVGKNSRIGDAQRIRRWLETSIDQPRS
jgi:D-alanyl-D-alanine endopeptidase (penicillin-binding protein 7)